MLTMLQRFSLLVFIYLAVVFASIVLPSPAQAAVISTTTLHDQFDTPITIDESTQWLIFSADKEVSDQINQAFDNLRMQDIKSKHGAYVADISKMPKLVTQMFALPKMKKYNFKVMLDDEGTATATWPRQEKKATLMQLKNLEIVSTTFVGTTDEIQKFIKSQL